MKPPKEAIEEALKFPNAYVYAIDDDYNKEDKIPPSAIKGAWKTNEHGIIVGEFIPNPNYVPKNK